MIYTETVIITRGHPLPFSETVAAYLKECPIATFGDGAAFPTADARIEPCYFPRIEHAVSFRLVWETEDR